MRVRAGGGGYGEGERERESVKSVFLEYFYFILEHFILFLEYFIFLFLFTIIFLGAHLSTTIFIFKVGQCGPPLQSSCSTFRIKLFHLSN